MRYVMVGLAVLAAACGESRVGVVDAPAADAADATRVVAAGVAACTTSALPLTGACADANPALFLVIDDKRETAARGCVWRTEEVKLADDEALVFRAQDCTGEQWDQQLYSLVGHYLKVRPAPLPEDQASFVAEIFEVGGGQTAEQVALQTLANAPEDQRARCITAPLTGFKVAGRAFELTPNDELTREMDQASLGEPWDACGPNGVTMDAIQFWEGRGRHALFHMLGQDDPLWDPASFTFYVKNPDGSWSKKD